VKTICSARISPHVVLNLQAVVNYFVLSLLNFTMTRYHSLRISHLNAGMLIRWNMCSRHGAITSQM